MLSQDDSVDYEKEEFSYESKIIKNSGWRTIERDFN